MVNKVELPVSMPLYATYQHQGSGCVASAANPTISNWYVSNCVSLQCNRKFLTGYTTPQLMICNTSLEDNPHLEKHIVNFRFTWDSRDKIIKRMLRLGYYVYFYGVDDFYIDGKTYFNQQHFTHDGMICGFDEEKKTYSLFSYDQRWIYRVFETPMKSFGRAVRTEINRGYHGYVLAIKATGARVGLDMPLLNSNLKEYLHSDWARYPLDGEGDVYGTVVHDYLCLYLDRLANGDIPYEKMDHRLFRMIWEHKKGMLDRIRTVEERLGLSPDIGDGYAPLIAQADHMRMLYARYHRRRDDRLLGSIKTKLMEVKQREIVLLSHLTEAIDRAAAGTEVSA